MTQQQSIRTGILGYGNLGRGVELALRQHPDMELVGIFTRRDPKTIQTATGAPVFELRRASAMKNEIDVMILCGGSATDLMEQSPEFVRFFHIVDSFDTHARIPEHYRRVGQAARESGKLAIISAGWDPGLFSVHRLYAEAVLPHGRDYTFWGPGISQGHSDALRRVPGVLDARQYTLPSEDALDAVRGGEAPELTTRQKHTRLCFVAAEEGADREAIRQEIVQMPHYFADYDTTVEFVSREELLRDHGGMPHGGFVFRSGTTGENGETRHIYEFSLKLDSNPEFTSSVLVAYARAAVRMAAQGQSGARTVLEVPPVLLSPRPIEDLIGGLL